MRLAHAHLHADGLAARELAARLDKLEQAGHRVEGRVPAGRDAVLVGRRAEAARVGNDRRDLGGGEDAAVPGLGALRELDLDHLDEVARGVLLEELGVESAHAVDRLAAGEVAGAHVPHHVRAERVELRDAALARVVVEAALLGAEVEGGDGAAGQRAVRHRRDVEYGGRVGLGARGPADGDARHRMVDVRREHRVRRPLVPLAVDVALGAERHGVRQRLGAAVDEGAHLARVPIGGQCPPS